VAYSVASDVKPILQIAAEDLTFNTEIEDCIVSADALIDGLVKKAGLSVPNPVPQNISDASAYFAAWMFRHRRDPSAAEVFWVEAHKFLDTYISAEDGAALRRV
jgi:hypothetical protein